MSDQPMSSARMKTMFGCSPALKLAPVAIVRNPAARMESVWLCIDSFWELMGRRSRGSNVPTLQWAHLRLNIGGNQLQRSRPRPDRDCIGLIQKSASAGFNVRAFVVASNESRSSRKAFARPRYREGMGCCHRLGSLLFAAPIAAPNANRPGTNAKFTCSRKNMELKKSRA